MKNNCFCTKYNIKQKENMVANESLLEKKICKNIYKKLTRNTFNYLPVETLIMLGNFFFMDEVGGSKGIISKND